LGLYILWGIDLCSKNVKKVKDISKNMTTMIVDLAENISYFEN
jgi:hypothetical protein